jgi:hypothetical protein
MPIAINIEQIRVYRITHIENIPHVLEFGVTHRNSMNSNPNFVPIGDQSLIDNRSSRVVHVDNGDFFNENNYAITLGDLIPFYFGIKMPMLYVIQNGGNFVPKATIAEDIIYISYPLKQIIDLDINFYFTDGHATDNMTTFYDDSKAEQLPSIINWQAVKALYWGGHENLNIKRKKQAELLLCNDLPFDDNYRFGCYNANAKNKLIAMGIEEKNIIIAPNAYY